MKSTKCMACGYVGRSDAENCKGCGQPLVQHSSEFSPRTPNYSESHTAWHEPSEGEKKGLAIASLVLGILSFLTLGLLGIGAVAGIIVAIVAMKRVKEDPWTYGGRGLAIAGLVLNGTALVSAVPVGIIAAIAIPNLMAARMAANEGSAIRSLRTISSAEATYQSLLGHYGTLDELATKGLIDPMLASGAKNGYKFSVEVKPGEYPNPEGFEVVGVPMTYQTTGRRSFYIDDSFVIRAADNHGGPSTKLDTPLQSDYDFPRTSEREYKREVGY
jgi:type IV pilus assembly protein PilA